MKSKIVVIIEHAGDNLSAYVADIDGIAVIGNTVDEIKTSMIEAIEEYKSACRDYNLDMPEVLAEDYDLIFEIDVCSFLKIYEGIFTKSALEKMTGINQKQLWHYANGRSKPRQAQRIKIEQALHRLGQELISLHL